MNENIQSIETTYPISLKLISLQYNEFNMNITFSLSWTYESYISLTSSWNDYRFHGWEEKTLPLDIYQR